MSAVIRSSITLISPSCVNNNAAKVNDIEKVDIEAGEEYIPIEIGTQCVPNLKLLIKP